MRGDRPRVGPGAGAWLRARRAEKVLLNAETVLYQFNPYPSLHGPDAGAQYRPVSPWWSPYRPFRHDPGWEAKKKIARHFPVSVREWGRPTSAFKENWNSLQYLLVITLKRDVDAFFGGFSHQRLDANAASRRITHGTAAGFRSEARGGGRNLPGGGTQFSLPPTSRRGTSSRCRRGEPGRGEAGIAEA